MPICGGNARRLRDKIDGLQATFHMGRAVNRNLRQPDQDKPLQAHPIVKRHAGNGRESRLLSIQPMQVGIAGWDDDAAQDLLAEVYEWGNQERFQARHAAAARRHGDAGQPMYS